MLALYSLKKMIKTRVLQNRYSDLNSVFIFNNFLDLEYLKKVRAKTFEITKKDSMNKSTNVKASMTDWKEVLNHKVYQELTTRIIQILDITIQLRSPACDNFEYMIDDFWAMRHYKGDNSNLHIHLPSLFSGVFYVDVPGETILKFNNFDYSEVIKTNSLYLFASTIQHEVFRQEYEEPRLSVAFNISLKKI
jgi:hypothetical protein